MSNDGNSTFSLKFSWKDVPHDRADRTVVTVNAHFVNALHTLKHCTPRTDTAMPVNCQQRWGLLKAMHDATHGDFQDDVFKDFNWESIRQLALAKGVDIPKDKARDWAINNSGLGQRRTTDEVQKLMQTDFFTMLVVNLPLLIQGGRGVG